MIRNSIPHADVSGFVGRRSSFEVNINDKVAFSKLERGGYPDFNEIVQMVQRSERGQELGTVQKTQSACTIL